jgi:hypothetical protein
MHTLRLRSAALIEGFPPLLNCAFSLGKRDTSRHTRRAKLAQPARWSADTVSRQGAEVLSCRHLNRLSWIH